MVNQLHAEDDISVNSDIIHNTKKVCFKKLTNNEFFFTCTCPVDGSIDIKAIKLFFRLEGASEKNERFFNFFYGL